MLKSASSKIVIMSPYFLPGRAFRKQLRQATQRGVKVQLILAGMSDMPLSKYGERYLYDWLIRYNIQIYEYQKSVLHGKIATCDGHWTTVGSYNINNVSAYASIELNLEVKNDVFAKQAEDALTDIIEKECIEINSKFHHHQKNWLNQFFRWCSYQLLRFVLLIFTFNLKREN
jgi:cardiolipin synthase